jgi:superfamily II helicase
MQGYGKAAAFDLETEMRTIINKFKKINYKATQEALEVAGNNMAIRVSRRSPTGITGLFRASWKLKKYPNAVYVYNSRGVKGIDSGIPVSNLAEYAHSGPSPFIKNVFEANKRKIYDDFSKIMQQKLNK